MIATDRSLASEPVDGGGEAEDAQEGSGGLLVAGLASKCRLQVDAPFGAYLWDDGR